MQVGQMHCVMHGIADTERATDVFVYNGLRKICAVIVAFGTGNRRRYWRSISCFGVFSSAG